MASKRIGDEFKPDLAILNVNAHLPPDDAARAHADLGYPRVISSHMGAYLGSPRPSAPCASTRKC